MEAGTYTVGEGGRGVAKGSKTLTVYVQYCSSVANVLYCPHSEGRSIFESKVLKGTIYTQYCTINEISFKILRRKTNENQCTFIIS